MTITTDTPPLADQLVTAATGALELFGIYLGDRLGLYDLLADGTPRTSADVAAAAAIDERYAREWLEQQAVAGVLEVDDAGAEPAARRFHLPSAHVGAVADPTAADHVAPLARMLVGVATALDHVVAAYRTGGGVPFARYGADLRHGQGAINRPAFSGSLVQEWLPALQGPALGRLTTGGRILDLGAGQGWSAIAMAKGFPAAEVWAFDTDAASVEDARRHAQEAGVDLRVECADAAEAAALGPFDLVTILEALHDMAQPASVLAAARAALAEGGSVLVADEAVAPRFAAPGDEIERMMYGWSITHCLPACRTEEPSAAIGTVIREDTVRELAAAAGFGSVEVLDADGGFFRLYELRP